MADCSKDTAAAPGGFPNTGALSHTAAFQSRENCSSPFCSVPRGSQDIVLKHTVDGTGKVHVVDYSLSRNIIPKSGFHHGSRRVLQHRKVKAHQCFQGCARAFPSSGAWVFPVLLTAKIKQIKPPVSLLLYRETVKIHKSSFFSFLSYHRITESQNSFGWKGP